MASGGSRASTWAKTEVLMAGFHRLLDILHVFQCGLQVGGEADPGKDTVGLLCGEELLLHKGVQIGAEHDLGLFQGLLTDVVKIDAPPAHGVALGDAGPHGARAQNGDPFDRFQPHSNGLLSAFV